jgi:hypothetical protein
VTSAPVGHRRPIYRSRTVLVAPSVVSFVLWAWLALGIAGRGCPGTITFDELIPLIITLGVGVIGAGALLALGTLHRRRDELVFGACLDGAARQ